MLNEILLLAQRARGLASRNVCGIFESVRSRSWSGELLEVGEVLNDQPLFLSGQFLVPPQLHEVNDALPILIHGAVFVGYMLPEVCLVGEISVAELTHKRPCEHWRLVESSQRVSCDLDTRHERWHAPLRGAG